MRKSLLFIILAVAVILGFIFATPYYYGVSPQNSGEQGSSAGQ
ncbi:MULTISPECIES: hypothetical protein [Pseudomonadota]|nr:MULTISPECIES: hypothetical protein [Pseudomonadota]MDL2203297.1 hypothetical protein [Brucella intermedia]